MGAKKLEALPVEYVPAALVPLAELVAEGLAGSIDELAARLDGAVVLDDVGRRCCTRDTARELFADHARRQAEAREVQLRNQERAVELDQQWRRENLRGGVPVHEGTDGVSAASLMLEAGREAARDRRGSMLDELMSGSSHYHPIRDEEES